MKKCCKNSYKIIITFFDFNFKVNEIKMLLPNVNILKCLISIFFVIKLNLKLVETIWTIVK